MNNEFIEDPIAYIEAIQEIKYPCPKCGRKAVIPAGVKRQICHWRGIGYMQIRKWNLEKNLKK